MRTASAGSDTSIAISTRDTSPICTMARRSVSSMSARQLLKQTNSRGQSLAMVYDAAGQLTVWPSDQAIPNTYALSVQPGQSTTNLATVALGTAGSISIHNGSSASVNLTAGVEGWFTT